MVRKECGLSKFGLSKNFECTINKNFDKTDIWSIKRLFIYLQIIKFIRYIYYHSLGTDKIIILHIFVCKSIKQNMDKTKTRKTNNYIL